MTNLRHAVRTLGSQPIATTVMVLTIAAAIASTTVIYSVIDMVRGFIPVRSRAGIVYVTSTDTRVLQAQGTTQSVVMRTRVSAPDLADYVARSATFEELAGFEMGSVTLTGVDTPLRVSSVRVTPNLVGMWGLTPVLGRSFNPGDGRAGAQPVTLLTFGFWQRQFSSDPSAIGQSMLLDGVAHTIVGVLPSEAGTGVLRNSDVFLPLLLDALRGDRRERALLVTGRLAPGVTRARADAELQAIARQLRDEHPDTNRAIGASVLPLIEATGFNVRILLSILGLIALLVLVVACANVSGILVAQSVSRRHEVSVRAALGAGRLERVRQLMTESLLASALACAVGLLFAAWGISALRWLGGGDSFGLADIRLNGRVLLAALVTALAAPFGFGLFPAWRTAAPDARELKEEARGAGIGLRGRRTRSLLVALQAGAAMILMVQIGTLVRTTWTLSDIAPGFDPARVVTFRIGLPASRYEEPDAITRFTTELMSRLRALPGVASAGVIDRLPVADREPQARLTVEGAPPVFDPQPTIARAAIAGDYLETLRIPVRRGRAFSEAELSDATPVALVNEEAARRFWPGRDPIGGRLALDAAPGREAWLDIVGVVGNVRNSDIDQGALPQVFVPMTQQPGRDLAVVVKSVGAATLQLLPAIRSEVARLDRDQPIHDIALMSRVLFDDLAGTYVLTALLGAIAFVALCLSAAGVYGLVSFSVAQRRREIGVRMALGARPGTVVRMVLASAARPVAAGIIVGLAAAAGLVFGIGLSVPGVEARDPVNYVGVTVAIAMVTFVASYLPARRAAAIDPVVTLRH